MTNNYTAKSDKFQYYLQPNEIENYKRLFVENVGKVPFHRADYFLTNYFLDMHQNAFVRVRAVVLNKDKITKKEIKDCIVKFEKEEADKSEYPFLGIENNIRIDSFVRNIAKWADNQNKLAK